MTDRVPDLVYLCDWLPPDFGAVGQYALMFAREEATRGNSVVLYGLSSSKSSCDEEDHGAGLLKIVRLRAPIYDRAALSARAWWTVHTNLAIVLRALRDLRRARRVLFTGSPPFLLHLLAPLNVLLRKQLVYRITDFYPECLIAEYSKVPLVLNAVVRLTRFWRKRVSQFEALGEDQRRRLVESGISADRIVVRRDRSPARIDSHTRPLPRPSGFDKYKLLLYSGNFGVAHDYRTILDGYRRHHRNGSGRVALWLNAIGRGADILERNLKEERLPHLRTRPVPLDDLGRLLVTADAHLVTLRKEFWGYVLPSKIYGCIESGRPILYVGPEESDVFLLGRANCPDSGFIRVANGDGEQVKNALEQLARA